MNSSKFKRPSKAKESFVSGGVEIEDIQKRKTDPTSDENVRMQVILTKAQRDWLRRKAYEEDTQMSKIIRSIIEDSMKKEN